MNPFQTGRARHALPLLAALLVLNTACGRGDTPSTATTTTSTTTTAATPADTATDVVHLDSVGIALGGIRVEAARETRSIGLPLTGSITYDADRVTHIGARTPGRVVNVAVEVGTRVTRGSILAELESADVGQIRADERQAESLLRIARENYAREQRLEQQGISSRKELLEAEAEMRRSEASLRSAQDRLSVLGAEHGDGGHFDLTAPFNGVVVGRNANRGQMAEPTDTLFTVADLSRLWIELDIFERDLTRVQVGQSVQVTTEAYPGRSFAGRIVYVAPIVDPAKRTIRARIAIPNEDAALKPGMFARATVQVDGGGSVTVVVPQDAVQELRGASVVFVPGARAGEFRARRVTVGDVLDGGHVVVRSGLSIGDRLVTAGAFALRSELLKGELGEEEH